MDAVVISCIALLCVVWAWTLRVIVKTLQQSEMANEPARQPVHVHHVHMPKARPASTGHSRMIQPAAPDEKSEDEEDAHARMQRSRTGVPTWNIEA